MDDWLCGLVAGWMVDGCWIWRLGGGMVCCVGGWLVGQLNGWLGEYLFGWFVVLHKNLPGHIWDMWEMLGGGGVC